MLFAYGAFTLYGWPFQAPSTRQVVDNSPTRPQSDRIAPHNTGKATLAGYCTFPVWAVPRSLAATDGIAFAFSSWGY